jgi:hypothetical protein
MQQGMQLSVSCGNSALCSFFDGKTLFWHDLSKQGAGMRA